MPLSTPYLNAHKEYSTLLGGTRVDLGYLSIRERAELILYDDRRIVWTSGAFDPKKIKSLDAPVRFWARAKPKYRLYLSFTKVHQGYPRQAVVKVPVNVPPPGKSGRTETTGASMATGYPEAVRKARSGVHASNASRAAETSDHKRSTNLRPNPETRNTPYNGVLEGVTFGSYALTVTPKSRLLYQRSWTGVRTPGYGKLKTRQLPVNPHTVSLKWVEFDDLLQWQRNNFRPVGDFNLEIDRYTLKYSEPGGPVHNTTARNMAIKRLIAKAGNEIQANLAQDCAQISQTVQLIGHNAQKVARSLLLLKKGNFLGAAEALTAGRTRAKMPPRKGPSRTKDLAENWLELQYGWKPLLKDIEGSMEALSKMASADMLVHRVTASAKVRSSVTSTYNSVLWPAKTGSTLSTTETQCRLQVRYKVRDNLKTFLAQTGFTNPINLVWEILPFSFVVDWFLPIGPYLETLSAWDGLQFVDGVQTQFSKQETVSAIDWSGQQIASGTNNLYEEHCRFRRTWIILNREKLVTFPSQTIPEFRNGLYQTDRDGNTVIDRALNAVSLLKAVFGK